MKMINRYEVPVIENSQVEMPIGSKILSAEYSHNKLFVNVMIDVMQTRRRKYDFKIFSTNEHFENIFGFEFLATLPGGKLHVFKKEKE